MDNHLKSVNQYQSKTFNKLFGTNGNMQTYQSQFVIQKHDTYSQKVIPGRSNSTCYNSELGQHAKESTTRNSRDENNVSSDNAMASKLTPSLVPASLGSPGDCHTIQSSLRGYLGSRGVRVGISGGNTGKPGSFNT